MPYIAASDLVTKLPGLPTITGSSRPLTMAGVASICAQVSAQLDGAAAAGGYSVPVATSATTAYTQLVDAAEMGAGWKVLRSVYPSLGGPSDESSLASEYRLAYLDFLRSLRRGETKLPDAGSDTGGAGRELPRASRLRSAPVASSVVLIDGVW